MTSETTVVNNLVQSEVRLDGKTVLITGANIGIGYETALDLARRGARVLMACRNMEKAEAAKVKILEEVKDANLVIKKLDLSSLASVRECAKDVNESEERLDILINTQLVISRPLFPPGVMLCPDWKTADGFEMQMGTNHVGHFLLTNLLLDLIKKSAPSRIVILSSAGHQFGKMVWDDLMQKKGPYNSAHAYGRSKLANILHCKQLAKMLEGTGVTCYAVHPGVVESNLSQHLDELNHLPSFFWRMAVKASIWFYQFQKISTREGAQTSIYCAIAPELANQSGKYYTKCVELLPSAAARNMEDAARLWKISEEWTAEKPQEEAEKVEE